MGGKTDVLLEALEENMLHLEIAEEQRLEMIETHAEEMERHRKEMADRHGFERQSLKEKLDEDKNDMRRDFAKSQAECEEQVAQSASDCQRQIAEISAKCKQAIEEAVAEAKAASAREIADVRVRCDKDMAEERAEMDASIAETRATCERMAAEKEGMSGRIAEFREETERYIAHEKAEMLRKTSESRAECDRIAREKAEMLRDMAKFQEQTQLKMAEEKAELSVMLAESRQQCERKIAAEKTTMAKTNAETKAEYQRVDSEKQVVMRELAEFRAETERNMAEEQNAMKKKLHESRAQSERRIAEEKLEMAREMAELRVEFERKNIAENDNYAKKIAERKLLEESESKKAQEEMARKMAELREDFERKLQAENETYATNTAERKQHAESDKRKSQEEKLEMAREMAELRVEFERKLLAENENYAQKIAERKLLAEGETKKTQEEMAKDRADFERKLQTENETYAKNTAERKQQAENDKRKAQEEKLEMAREMAELRVEFERKLLAENDNYAKKMAEARAECERMAEQKILMTREMAKFRSEVETKMNEDKMVLMKQIEQLRCESEQIAKQKTQKEKEMTNLRADMELKMMEMTKKTAESRTECERIEAEKAGLQKEMAKFRQKTEKKMADEQAEMRKRISESRAEYEQIVVQKAELAREMSLFRSKTEQKMADVTSQMSDKKLECEKLSRQKHDMEREITEIRNHTLKKLEAEKEEAQRKVAAARRDYEEQIQQDRRGYETQLEQDKVGYQAQLEHDRKGYEMHLEQEKRTAQQKLTDEREKTEAKLQAERQVTSHIMQTIRELPPLQAAMELGDIRLLEEELDKWEAHSALPERFGECKGVVQAVVKLARERLIVWREVEHTLHDVIRQMQRLPGTVSALEEHCHRLFRALKEAQLTKMDLRRSDPQATEHICEVLLAWEAKVMSHSNYVQKAMIRKVAMAQHLGTFDFADLDICLRLVDRDTHGSEELLTRALAIVEDESTSPKDMKPLLAHLETMLFFLKYTKSEDLAMCHAEFLKPAGNSDRDINSYIRWAAQECPPGSELVRLPPGRDVMDKKDVTSVLEEMRQVRPGMKDCLGTFREIFYQWAVVMRDRFDLLVLPHHTQVVCLQIFRRFMEASQQGTATYKSLIAQVGTGEGKSMIVAALAIYVVVVFKKKVHVVVDDETLLERDYLTFKSLFDTFRVPLGRQGQSRALTSSLCVSEERLASDPGAKHFKARVDPDVDICYCEAKHVQSFYASIARGQKRDFEGYDGRVLILDEVDALVIDEEPNEAFVYPNKDLGRMATQMAGLLKRGVTDVDQFKNDNPACPRVYREMTTEWARGAKMVPGEDFVYAQEAGKYQALQSGRANPKAWSLALECRNFQDGLSREIVLQERLFVMSRPRVFRKYHRILGLSGSIGSTAERSFLKDTYRAAFFEVPPFLKTCRGSPFHEPVPAPLGELMRPVYVEASSEDQLKRLCEVALAARERVPVLVIAKDRGHCDILVEGLRNACRSRGLGGNSDDLVRSLARNLYEADPEQWKENLNRATLPLGDGKQGGKSWRVTVTDPRGGRGTDYRVDFKEVDDAGGLLLLPTVVPTAQREWTQFLGRTARQDRRGQFCAVLCQADYAKMCTKYNERLPSDGSIETIQAILSWGDRQAAERISGSAALYNCGVRVNELCEEIFGKQPELLDNSEARESIVEVCQRFRWMSIKEVDEAFAKIPSFNPRAVPTEAKDMGAPAKAPAPSGPDASMSIRLPGDRSTGNRRVSWQQDAGDLEVRTANGGAGMVEVSKVVVFCLDWSASMMSQDTGTKFTRFGICVDRVQRILREQVRDQDLMGVVGFGANIQTVIPPTQKAGQSDRLEAQIGSLKPNLAGGTCFFDAVAQCLTLLTSPEHAPPEAPRWLLCLTDGDDIGSRKDNENGEKVTAMLQAGIKNLNMIMITVGKLKDKNVRVIDGWVQRVTQFGGFGKHLSSKDAVSIGKAFEVVAEVLAADVGGAVEC